VPNPRFYKGAGRWQGKVMRFDGYEPDREGLAQCAVGREIKRAVTTIVKEAIEYAQLIAPNDDGDYQRGFSTDVQIVPDIPYRVRGEPMARWSGRVVNSVPHAILVEVGSGRNGQFEHRVMRRTLEWIEMVADD
jgi:hypothetical protein